MKLLSRDGASIELRPTTYQFGAIPQSEVGTDWDANWLVIRGDVKTTNSLEWTFIDPCLTTWEARELASWLRDAASGLVAPTTNWSEEEGLLHFTEPNVAFSLKERIEGRTPVRVHFSLEALPPWLREANRPKLFEYFLVLDLKPKDLTAAAEEWNNDCEPFPER